MRKDAGLPKGWEVKALGDIANVQVGRDLIKKSFSKHKTETHTYPVYSNSVERDGLYGYYDFEEYPANSVTVVGRGEIGTAFSRQQSFGAIGRLLVLSSEKMPFDSRYLASYINFGVRILNEKSGVPQLPGASFSKYKVLLPPLGEQKAIADVLSTWDEAIEITERLIKAKEKQFRWLSRTLIGDQCKTNSSWKKANLSDLCQIKKGEQLNVMSMKEDGAYYALNGGIEPSGRTDCWNTEAETVTISEGGRCGYVSFNTERFWSGGHLYSLLQLKNHIDKEYLFFFLKHYEPKIMNLRVGSVLPNIQKKDIDKFEVIYPALKEQKKIAGLMKTAQQEVGILKELVEKYRIQKRGLMQKLLTGEWRVKAKDQGGK